MPVQGSAEGCYSERVPLPTHRNHPTEDDHQGPSDGTLASPDDGSRDPEVKGHGRLMAGIVEVN